MRFILESDNTILINKYSKDNLILKPDHILFIGKNKRGVGFPYKKVWVPRVQIAQFDNIIYITDDQIPRDTIEYSFNASPLKQQEMPKYKWLDIKQNHPYEGK